MAKKPRRVCFKFGPDFPIRLMNAMQDFGWQLYARKSGEYIIYEKLFYDEGAEEVDESGVPNDVQKHLEARLKKVVDVYLDPYSNVPAIKAQCMMIANGLSNEFEREWVINWIADNLDSEHFSPPWEKEDRFDPDQPEFGFC